MKINDFMTKDGWLREHGRVMRDMYLKEVKSPAESKYPFDYFKILATIPADQAFRSLKGGGCPLVHGLTAEAEAASGRVRERQLHPLSDRLVEERPGLFRAARRRSLMSLPNK
jgi:hypothetical protein